MIEIEQVKQIVLKDVENSGLMDKVRAQLKNEVYKIIEKQNMDLKEKVGFQWKHPILNKIQQSREGMLCLELIQEFLEFFKFEFTLDVFKKECSQKNKTNRDKIVDNLNMKKNPESSKPVLVQLIKDYDIFMKGKDIPKDIISPDLSASGSYNEKQFAKSQQDQKQVQKENKSGSNNQSDQRQIQQQQQQQQQKEKQQKEEREREQKKLRDLEEKLRIQKEKQEEEERQRELERELEEQRILRAKLDQMEKERQEREAILEQQREEQRRKDQLEKERRDKIDRDYREREEKDRREAEEKKKKEEEEKKKKELEERRRPKTAPIVKPATAVNTIRGAQNQDVQIAASLYGNLLNVGQKPEEEQYAIDYADMNQYGYNTHAGGFGVPANKFQAAYQDPYANIDMNADLNTTKKNKFDKKKNDADSSDYPEEDLDEFVFSSGSHQFSKEKEKNKNNNNPFFTSSEDVHAASQSLGVDVSVDSDALENYDYVEPINKNRR